MTPAFVHLRVHTEYSLVNGVVRMKPLVNACAKAGMPAVAVTDQCNLFAMVKFYKAALLALDVTARDEPREIEITAAVLTKQHEARRLIVIGLVVQPDIDADEGLHAGRERGLVALHNREKIALVGARHRRHARLGAGVHQGFHAHDTVD